MTCRECDSTGTLFVLPGYVDRYRPAVPPGHPDYIKVEAERAALAWSVYPCPECQADAFQKWSAGAYSTAPLSARSTVPAKARGGNNRSKQDPLPVEPTWLAPEDWSLTRKDLE